MATYQIPHEGCVSFKTASDLSSSQYMGVQISAAKTAGIGEANGDLNIGILMNKPTSGQAAVVATQAGMIVPVYAGDAIALGVLLTTEAAGHIVTAADNDICIGIALETAGASGDIIEMLMISPAHVADISYYPTGA